MSYSINLVKCYIPQVPPASERILMNKRFNVVINVE